jgi:prevent-host-death family protein
MEAIMWQVAEAKNKFSELITRALTEGPQRVRRRGQTVVVLSEAEYERLAGEPAKKMSLGEYLLQGPSFEGVDLSRDRSPPREVNFDFDDE